jgi:hypothetical protein
VGRRGKKAGVFRALGAPKCDRGAFCACEGAKKLEFSSHGGPEVRQGCILRLRRGKKARVFEPWGPRSATGVQPGGAEGQKN